MDEPNPRDPRHSTFCGDGPMAVETRGGASQLARSIGSVPVVLRPSDALFCASGLVSIDG